LAARTEEIRQQFCALVNEQSRLDLWTMIETRMA